MTVAITTRGRICPGNKSVAFATHGLLCSAPLFAGDLELPDVPSDFQVFLDLLTPGEIAIQLAAGPAIPIRLACTQFPELDLPPAIPAALFIIDTDPPPAIPSSIGGTIVPTPAVPGDFTVELIPEPE